MGFGKRHMLSPAAVFGQRGRSDSHAIDVPAKPVVATAPVPDPVPSRPPPVESGIALSTRSEQHERWTALRDHVHAIFVQASKLADSVRDKAPLSPPDASTAIDLAAFPISVRHFERHFHHTAGIRLKHSCYGMIQPSDPDSFQPKLQFFMLDLTSLALAINTRYEAAAKDGALTIALQSPAFIAELDAAIVTSAVVVALLETMIENQRRLGSGDDAGARLAGEKDHLTRAVARARASMLDPSALQSLVPAIPWPMACVEVAVDDHEGQIVLNEVYFPKQHATALMAQQADHQANAARSGG